MPGPGDIALTHDASGSTVEQWFRLAADPESGSLLWSPGLAPTVSPTQRTDTFSYAHRDPRIDLPAAFEDWSYGAGFEDALEVGTLGFPGYHYSQGVDLSWRTRGYLAPQKQTGGSTTQAPIKFVESDLGLFALTSRYVYENVSGTWTQRFDIGAGMALTDLREFKNSNGTYLVLGVESDPYYHSTDGVTWIQSENPASVGTFRAAASANTSSGTSVGPAKPTNTADGDTMVAVVLANVTGGTTIVPPAGWTQLHQSTQNTVYQFAVFYRIAGATEGSSYTFTSSSGTSGRISGSIVTYQSTATVSSVDVSGATEAGSDQTPTAPSVTTTGENRVILSVFGLATGAAAGSWTHPTSTTERVDYHPADGDPTLHVADATQAAAGASTARTATWSEGADFSWGVTIALKPVVPSGASDVARWEVRGSASGEPLLWAVDSDGDLRNTPDPVTPAAWSSADATQVGEDSVAIAGLAVVDNVFYLVHDGGITSYDGTTVETVWAPQSLRVASNQARPVVGPDNRLYFAFGGTLIRYGYDEQAGANTVRKVWPRGPQVGSSEINGVITAIAFDEGDGYFAVKNAAGNTYIMKFDPSYTVEVDGTLIWPAHTWFYNGSSDCRALLVVGGSSDTFSTTNPQLIMGDGTTADYLILPRPGYRPEDDSNCRFDVTADRPLYGPYVTFRAQSFPKWVTSGDIEAVDLTASVNIDLQYQVPGGSATTIVTATADGRSTADVATEVSTTVVRPVLLFTSNANTASPVLKGSVLHATPNPPRDRAWQFTVEVADQLERLGGGAWPWPAALQETFLFDAKNERCTLTDPLGSTHTVKVLDVLPEGARYDERYQLRQLFTVQAVAI